MRDFIDKTSEQSGTPLNRDNLMALQGFDTINTVFSGNTITETNAINQKKITTFNDDGSITEKFIGDKTITKTTIFNDDGSITEAIS